MRWIAITLLTLTVALSVSFAAATSLTVSSDNLGSGSSTIEVCDPDGVQVSYNAALDAPPRIESATISGIDYRCLGQTLTLSISDFGNQLLSTTEVVVSGDTIPVVFPTPIPAPSSIAPARVTITITGVVPF